MEHKQWDIWAKDYHSITISPFHPDVINPIYEDIRNMRPCVVADIGTGRGDLLAFLSETSKKVYAIDFSENMLKIAKKRSLENVEFRRCDIRQLKELNLELDLAIAANSILHPDTKDVQTSLAQIFGSIKKGGRFIGIFPSMEAIIYNFGLVYEREAKKYDDKTALRRTRKIVERGKYSLIRGIYDDDGDCQKLYYRFELRKNLKDAGFGNIRFKKVKYPWGEASGDFEQFPGRRYMWDWYVTADKNKDGPAQN